MSHFTVLVVGDDLKAQLQPFHEFECTGEDDQYVVDVDITDKVRSEIEEEGGIAGAVEYYIGEGKIVSDESEIDRSGPHKYGYAVVKDGQLVKAVDRTNPNAKWDWWLLGGRWTGYFQLKPGVRGKVGAPGVMTSPAKAGRADQCRWGDVDVEGMQEEARVEAEFLFASWQAIYEAHGRPKGWDEVREAHGTDYDAAREEYHAQSAVKAMRRDEALRWMNPEDLGYDREAYVRKCMRTAIVPFAILKDGVWYEKGKMGWWACVSDVKGDWLEQAEKLLQEIAPDTLVSLVDCHI